MADMELFRKWADERWPGLPEALDQEPSISLRINPAKRPHLTFDTDGEVPWCKEGLYLSERPRFTFDPQIHQGRYYVQDASSMAVGAAVTYLAGILQPGESSQCRSPLLYLDACAAPGGKTTGAISALPPSAIVFANEFDFRRADVLHENIAKWGSPRVVVTRGDTCRYGRLHECFDIIAVDAPCSGEGMMRKDHTAVEQWSQRLVTECAARQRQILDNIWPALRPGGFLIYSTCTFNDVENEQVAEGFAEDNEAEFVQLPLTGYQGVITSGAFYRFLPGRVRGEGLCVCALRKPGVYVPASFPDKVRKRDKRPNNKSHQSVPLPAWIQSLLPREAELNVSADGVVSAMPVDMAKIVNVMVKPLDVVSAGVELGCIKGHDFIPSQALAMSWWMDAANAGIPVFEVDPDTALAYLRRQVVTLPEGIPRGFVLLTYGSYPLGWVKNLGQRSNNQYPAPWRIISL